MITSQPEVEDLFIPFQEALAQPKEHDACAIVAAVKKDGTATHGNLKRTLNALSKMGHRSGDVNGEGDGCGVLTDIPREIWAEMLEEEGKPVWLAEDKRFFVGHFMISRKYRGNEEHLQERVIEMLTSAGADILYQDSGQVRSYTLGLLAKQQEPLFWQVAGIIGQIPLNEVEKRLFDIALEIEERTPIHVASLSSHSVVYKVRGSVETLYQYYPVLRQPNFKSTLTLGHTRYSTNTATAFERVQPFNLLGHNGEINTIARLREEALMAGVQLTKGGSDSQDVDRLLATLIHHYDFTLTEAMELVFPPVRSEIQKFPEELAKIYNYYRQALGPYAQGPAAIIARYGDECTFSVDALGLRPLWFGETEKEYFFSSEKGVYELDALTKDPVPFSPGEKKSVRIYRNDRSEVFDYPAIQQRLLNLAHRRFGSVQRLNDASRPSSLLPPSQPSPSGGRSKFSPQRGEMPERAEGGFTKSLAAFGWSRDDLIWAKYLADEGKDPVGSLGHDSPLAALSEKKQNIANYFKEAVAVVTNPAMDRVREQELFGTSSILGERPSLYQIRDEERWVLETPILLGGSPKSPLLDAKQLSAAALRAETTTLEELMDNFGERAKIIGTYTLPDETVRAATQRLVAESLTSVQKGAHLLILDDTEAFLDGHGWVDPLLIVAAIDKALRNSFHTPEGAPLPLSLRRMTGIVLRSGAMRNLHDLILALGLGADAIAPYLLFESALNDLEHKLELPERIRKITNTTSALRIGLEKIISTMGIHELRGYGRLFSSIGLSQALVDMMNTTNFAGSAERGLTWDNLDDLVKERKALVDREGKARLFNEPHLYPKVWKKAHQLAQAGAENEDNFEDQVENLLEKTPLALRHTLQFKYAENSEVNAATVDAGITGHDLPFVISSMSFGSQGETAFRAYAEAAYRLNMLSLNGEGGEIEDMLGKYPHNRGMQIASGRFGVDAALLNATNLIEIKVGQGAKPGEGGHLPSKKVTEKIGRARHVNAGTSLISPSNNHDIYSIEDLAQFIEELKTINPKARIAVKIPVVPGIGVIAVGIAKAGADIINITGFDGGTGAARKHAIKHVGLPAEIGVAISHQALTESRMRNRVEIWCDGGMRTAADAVKMICLGANRVGFGTMAMVSLGCTICRSCNTNTCHTGISTQIETKEEADEKGLKRFVPREFDRGVDGIVNVFTELGEEMKKIAAQLGVEKVQNLVGRTDLLEQATHLAQLDMSDLLYPAKKLLTRKPPAQGQRPLRRPRNHLTTIISNLVMETAMTGEEIISFEDDKISPVDRVLGTHLSGALTRHRRDWNWMPGHQGVGGIPETWRKPVLGAVDEQLDDATLRFYASSVPGNGLGAYNIEPIRIVVEGGAQDGVAKCMSGGRLIILKGYNHNGRRLDGAVGKGLAYGATGGLIIVQGNADSRACIRLSGADVIIGGKIRQPINDSLAFIGARANIKGFLCEYMTAGRVLVMGDPGPWICSGMTGGVLYLRLQPHLNFNREAIHRRIAKGADVTLRNVDESDEENLKYLLTEYADELAHENQKKKARRVMERLWNWQNDFVKIVPDI
ncbi:MAG: glutamate synthase [Chloroflexi bacterium]|nr:glutamate synthase [Chloroflexota bacterium]